jgi:hypothetical protein
MSNNTCTRKFSSFINFFIPCIPSPNSVTQRSRYYRPYRCSHKKYDQPDYCQDTTYNHQSRRYSTCNNAHSIMAVADELLCGKRQCYQNNLKRNGSTYCQCGEQGDCLTSCVGPPAGGVDCPHQVGQLFNYTILGEYSPRRFLFVFFLENNHRLIPILHHRICIRRFL